MLACASSADPTDGTMMPSARAGEPASESVVLPDMVKGLLRFALIWGISILLTPYLNRLLDRLAERAPKVKGEDRPERQTGSAAAASQNAG